MRADMSGGGTFPSLAVAGMSRTQHRLPDGDLRDQAGAYFPSERHRDAINPVKIHIRRPDLSRGVFQARLLHEHADLMLAQGATREAFRRHAQCHNFGSTQEYSEGSKIDTVSILSLACMNDVEDYLVHSDHVAIQASENALAGDRSER